MKGKKRKKKEKQAKVEKKMKWTLNMFTDKQQKRHKNESK
jgi:hypothetical protein